MIEHKTQESTLLNHLLRPAKSRRGVVFYIVLAVTSVMGIFILFYQNFSRQLAFSSFYHVNREKIRNLTEVVIDSAFSHIQASTRDPGNPLTKQIIEQMRTSSLNTAPFTLEAPLFAANQASLLQGAKFKYTLTGKVFDKRIESPESLKYHPGEGLGTLEIAVNATLETPSGKVLAQCQRKRHYDIKTACLVSNYIKRQNSYAMTFPLDFALLVRNGLSEFKDGYRGQSLHDSLKLEILDQSSIANNKRGLVYFGRADNNAEDTRIYLNTAEDSASIIPSLPAANFEINQEECFRLFPNNAADEIRGIKGKFTIKTYPAARTGAPENPKEQEARRVLSFVSATTELVPKPAAISFGSFDKSYLDTFLCGAVTQRFMHFVHFDYDTTACEIYDGSDWLPADNDVHEFFRDKGTIIYAPDIVYFRTSSTPDAQQHKALADKVLEMSQRLNAPAPLGSTMREDYLPYSGQTVEKTVKNETFKVPPKFFRRDSTPLSDLTVTGGEGFRPFRHYTLCSARYFHAYELEKAGIYDRKAGVLNLRGIVSVELDHVTFNPPADRDHIIIKGSGAILAPNGFTINCGLKRENPNSDMLVLFTRKNNIRVATESRIEASLLAFNDDKSGSIIPSKPFDVLGAVGVDQLFISRYPSTPSKIEFDPKLRTDSDAEEIFSITMSPWIRFDDITFSKE